MENLNFEQLKTKVESLNSENKISKHQRKALFWQSHLRNQGLDVEFSLLLSDLEPDLAEQQVGPHGHTRNCYQLSWKKNNSTFSLVLTNIKANKTLPLASCPDYLLEIINSNMDLYLRRLSQYLVENASYDENYANEDDAQE